MHGSSMKMFTADSTRENINPKYDWSHLLPMSTALDIESNTL